VRQNCTKVVPSDEHGGEYRADNAPRNVEELPVTEIGQLIDQMEAHLDHVRSATS